MFKKLFVTAAIAAVVFLTGCAGVGPEKRIPMDVGGKKMTLVTHDQSWPDWCIDKDSLKLNYFVDGAGPTQAQYDEVKKVESVCHLALHTTRPSDFFAVGLETFTYALAGYVGIGIGSRAFTGAVQSQYARYGAWATGMSGLVNGLITTSGQAYTFENCGREILSQSELGIRVVIKSPY